MKGYDPTDAQKWILCRMDKKGCKGLPEGLERTVGSFIRYDLHFMRVTGVLDENDYQGESDYDEDEAFEFIYDAYLSDHPEGDDDMQAAALLNQYMELQAQYLAAHGLSD